MSFFLSFAKRCILFSMLTCIMVAYTSAGTPVRLAEGFTSPPWPPTRKGCTVRGLGRNPDPAYLSACFYAWEKLIGNDWGFDPWPRQLLELYSTPSFRTALAADEATYRASRTRIGVGGFMVFYFFDEFQGQLTDFEVLGARFDPEIGVAEVRTTLRGFEQNLYVQFARQGPAWRVNDILPHYDRDKNGKTLRDYLSVEKNY
jgi:hypothetical protein